MKAVVITKDGRRLVRRVTNMELLDKDTVVGKAIVGPPMYTDPRGFLVRTGSQRIHDVVLCVDGYWWAY